jgi:hypothetical protein
VIHLHYDVWSRACVDELALESDGFRFIFVVWLLLTHKKRVLIHFEVEMSQHAVDFEAI